MEMEPRGAPRPHDPFDDSAVERQRRMGLLAPEGGVDANAIAILSRVYAGLLMDELWDNCQNAEEISAACRRLLELVQDANSRRALLELCMLYDGLRRPLPEPIWWIAGSDTLLTPFMAGFAAYLAELSAGLEVM